MSLDLFFHLRFAFYPQINVFRYLKTSKAYAYPLIIVLCLRSTDVSVFARTQLKGRVVEKQLAGTESSNAALYKAIGIKAHRPGRQTFPALITCIQPQSPAAARGLKVNDRILYATVNGSYAVLIMERAGKTYDAEMSIDLNKAHPLKEEVAHETASRTLRGYLANNFFKQNALSGNVDFLHFRLSAQQWPAILNGQTNQVQSSCAKINLTMDNCPPIDPTERPRWLILDKEMGMGKPLFNQWLNVRERVRNYINYWWTRRANEMGTGRVYLHFIVWPGGHVSNVELEGNYSGDRSFATNTVRFIQSLDGNPVFYFPPESHAPDVHFQLWLENGNWANLPQHAADENLSEAEKTAKYERDQKRYKDLQTWLKQIGR